MRWREWLSPPGEAAPSQRSSGLRTRLTLGFKWVDGEVVRAPVLVAEEDGVEASQPNGVGGLGCFDEKVRAALRGASAMDALFMNGEFEHAIEEALNMFVRCVEALISLCGLPVGDRTESLSAFEEVFLSEKGERASCVEDRVWVFINENKEELGRDFETDFLIMRAVALNQNLRIGIASSPRRTRDLIVKLSWMSRRLIKHGERLKKLVLSQPTDEECG
jgi:hypothetical protein